MISKHHYLLCDQRTAPRKSVHELDSQFNPEALHIQASGQDREQGRKEEHVRNEEVQMDFLNSYLSDSNTECLKPDSTQESLCSPTPVHDVSSGRLSNLKKGKFDSMRKERNQYNLQDAKVRFIAPIVTDDALDPIYLTPKSEDDLQAVYLTPRANEMKKLGTPKAQWQDPNAEVEEQKEGGQKEEKEYSLLSMFRFLRKASK